MTRVTDVTGLVEQAGTHYRVLEVESPARIRTRFGNWLLRGETLATFDDEASGTRLVQMFETQGLISSISARFSPRIADPGCVDVSATPRAIDRRAAS